MKKFKVVIELSAGADIQESYDWGVLTWGKPMADEWVNKLQTTITDIGLFPESYAVAPESYVFLQVVRQSIFGRYRILFTIQKRVVHILHVRGAYI